MGFYGIYIYVYIYACMIYMYDIYDIYIYMYMYSSQNIISNDLSIISEWAMQWKMQFNPDPNKQANEV